MTLSLGEIAILAEVLPKWPVGKAGVVVVVVLVFVGFRVGVLSSSF
jgi:hypothetical protein